MLNTALRSGGCAAADARPVAGGGTRRRGLFIGCPDVDAAYEHLRAHGVPVGAPTVAPYGMKQLYVRDPDGFTLCFQWPAETPHTGPAT